MICAWKFTTFFRTVHTKVLIVYLIFVCVILCLLYYLPRFSCNVKACSTIKITIIPIHSKTKQNKILSRTVRLLHHNLLASLFDLMKKNIIFLHKSSMAETNNIRHMECSQSHFNARLMNWIDTNRHRTSFQCRNKV